MLTVAETAAFTKTSGEIWSEEERMAFIEWIAANPQAGDVIQGSGGLRKVRRSRAGMGKRGGTRVITYALMDDGTVWLLIAYTKAKFDNLPLAFLNALKKEMLNG